MSGMKIAFFGSSLVSASSNGAATYYRGVIRALHERGHRVTFYEPDAFERQKHRDMDDPAWARVVVYPAEAGGVLHALEQSRAADVVIKASGVGVYDELLEEAVVELRRPGQLAVFWDVDAPATLDELARRPDSSLARLIARYDHVFTCGGGAPVMRAYEVLGVRSCVPIYSALDPATHRPEAADPRFAGDLAFMGSRLPDRESRVDEFFIRAAAQLPERRFVLGGNGWHDKPLPDNVRYVGHVYTYEHNHFNASATSVLNVDRDSMARYGFSPPTRIFEAAGAGACIITDEWTGIELFLEPGREVLVAEGGDEVAAYVRSLSSPRARVIGEAARSRVLGEHTYAHRVEQIEAALTGGGQPHAMPRGGETWS
jgi:spore maturation protein CgeB